MPGSSTNNLGNVSLTMACSLVLSPAAVVANTIVEQTFTLTGVRAGDIIFVNKPSAQSGLGIAGARSTAANTIGINFTNGTGSDITPTAAERYVILVTRFENQNVENPPAVV